MKPAPSWSGLEGKSIWLIGGAGHLGAAIATPLDGLCQKAVCLDLGGRAANMVREKGLTRTIPESLDVTAVARLPGELDRLMERHGVPDGVVHLATASSGGRRLEDLPAEEFQRTFDLSLTPTFVLCRALAERMKPRGSGSIVLFSSMYGVVSPDPRIYEPPQIPNPIDYGAAKAAIVQMTRYLAVHYGPSGLRFNCVTPGPFPNPNVQKDGNFMQALGRKVPLGRIGQNHEIAGPVFFLLADGSSYVTGHSLMVDGGWTAW